MVIYAFPTDAAATDAGAELARYVGSGFGQTNFPTDAQFSVAQVGSTHRVHVVLGHRVPTTRRQPRVPSTPIGSVGQPFPVVK